MNIVWDEPKRLGNIEAHGLDFADAEARFAFEGALIAPSYPGPDGRARFVATGMLGGDLVTLVFSPLGSEAIALISLRPASRKERNSYASR